MKSFKKTFALMMVLVLIVALFSGSAVAAKKPSESRQNDVGIQTMTPGRWYEVKYCQKYSLKLSKDSIVSIDGRNKDDEYPIGITFYADKGMEKETASFGTKYDTGTMVVRKGVYYIGIYGDHWGGWGSDFENKTLGRVRVKITNVIDKKNYCPARAVSLKKRTKYTCAATPMNLYREFWFKIKITKKQNITVYSSEGLDGNCSLMSLDFQEYQLNNYDSTTLRSWDKVPAGTYYLVIGAPSRASMYAARTRTIWWR